MNPGSLPRSNVVSCSIAPVYFALTIPVYGRQEANIVVIQQRSPVLKVISRPTNLVIA